MLALKQHPSRSEAGRGTDRAVLHTTDGRWPGEMSTGSESAPRQLQTQGLKDSFVNSCHRPPSIFGAICALLPCNDQCTMHDSSGTWTLLRIAPHKSETQHCCMLGRMYSVTGYIIIPGMVSGLWALYLVVKCIAQGHSIQMLIFGFVVSFINRRSSNNLALGPPLAILYYSTS